MLAVELKHRLACPWNKSTGPIMVSHGGERADQDPQIGEPKQTPVAPMSYDLVFSPDSRLVATARNDRTILVWNVVTAERVCGFAVDLTPYRIAFTPDSKRILLCCKSKVIEEWSVEDGRRVRALRRKNMPGVCGAFSPDGIHAAISGGPKKIALFELGNGREVAPLALPHYASVVNFSPSGRCVVAGVLQEKDAMTLWDFETRRMKFSIHLGRTGCASVVFSPDESLLAYSGFFDGSVTLWKADVKLHRECPTCLRVMVYHPRAFLRPSPTAGLLESS